MAAIKYTPDEDVKVHEEGAIRLICAPFQSHENGLPEWIKNSADEYARNHCNEEDRVVLIAMNDGRRGRTPSISCLDFCGMTSAVIEAYFRYWANPDAARRGDTSDLIQGGKGNGGKCYMCQMFNSHSMLYSVKNNLGIRYGVVSGSVKFGYFPHRAGGRDFKVPNAHRALKKALVDIGCELKEFPTRLQHLVEECSGFTLISGFEPKGLSGRAQFTALIDHLQDHTQMIRNIEDCKVYVVLNGKALNNGKPLTLHPIQPLQGGEQPREIAVPDQLVDPAYRKRVSTTKDGALPQGRLVLRTSDRSMRWKRKGRHTITFRAKRGYIGYVPLPDLDVQSPFRDNIYGECTLHALEPFQQNDRSLLADAPLTRAVRVLSQMG